MLGGGGEVKNPENPVDVINGSLQRKTVVALVAMTSEALNSLHVNGYIRKRMYFDVALIS